MDDQDFLYYLEQFEHHVMSARRVPLTNKALLDEELLYELIDRLRDSLPQALRRAERIISDQDEIIRQAQERAEETVQGAEDYVEQLASETNVTRLAEQQAEELVARARETAREIQLGAHQYADEVLEEVQQTMERCLELVMGGRSQLQVAATREQSPAEKPMDEHGG